MTTKLNKAYLDAVNVYYKEPCARTFEDDLIAHLTTGFVFSRPDVFLMARPIVSTAQKEDIVNSWHRFYSSECDCWHVYLFAGNLVKALDFIPWELPLISFERRNVLRFHSIKHIRRLITK